MHEMLLDLPRAARRKLVLGAALFALAASGCSLAPAPTMSARSLPPPAAVIAPSGTLRAAINFGNPILAKKDPASGEARGVSVDLVRALGARLGVPVELVLYDAAGKVVDGLKKGEWDVGFVAIDPVRAADLEFTGPYVVIEGAYLVPVNSSIRKNDDVDREGIRVVVARGSAYDLFLTRELKKATLIRVPTSRVVVDSMVAQSLEVAAGVKQQVQADAERVPGMRLLDGRFMVINQALAAPRGRAEGARYLAGFVEEMKASGFVADALKRHGIEGAVVAPPASR